MNNNTYVGRFAPSPTGPLHFGSLVSALGSWADAKHHNGRWIVRIEDIDPARESPESTQLIIDSLKAHALHWDDISYQHQHSDRYDRALDTLRENQLLYACTCTRKNLRALCQSNYPGICKDQNHPEQDNALRIRVKEQAIRFTDLVCGTIAEDVSATVGDFIIRRRGPLYAYQLAVVVDDAEQLVTHVVRGADLLNNTARQIALQQTLHYPTPEYLHLPVAMHTDGRKLSKQTGAPALSDEHALDNLQAAWAHLGQLPAPDSPRNCEEFLNFCQKQWNRASIPTSSD